MHLPAFCFLASTQEPFQPAPYRADWSFSDCRRFRSTGHGKSALSPARRFARYVPIADLPWA